MQQQADPARLRRGAAMPLALHTPRTRSTLAKPSRVDQTQAAISLTALFGCRERLIGGRAAGPATPQPKASPPRTARPPGPAGGGSKLGGPHRRRLQLMPQFQAQIPHPLRDDLPRFLPPRSVRTPAVGVLFLVFIGKDRLKSPAMQVEGDDIGSSKSALRQIGEEEFVDETRAGETNPALLLRSRMGRHHHPAALSRWPHRHIRT